jgi:hypothetical protein
MDSYRMDSYFVNPYTIVDFEIDLTFMPRFVRLKQSISQSQNDGFPGQYYPPRPTGWIVLYLEIECGER